MSRWSDQKRRFGEPRWSTGGFGGTLGAWDGRVKRGAAGRGNASPGERVPLEDLLPLEKEDRRSRSLALLVALGLHIIALSLSFAPSVLESTQEPKQVGAVKVGRWIPPPPPAVRRPKRVVTEDVERRKIPVPDPAPDDPEPVPEPPANLVADLTPEVDVVFTTASPPPGGTGSVIAANSAGVTGPVLIQSTKVSPQYPAAAREAKVMGNVIVELTVFLDGTVGDAVILRTPGKGFGFEEEALRAVRQWRFHPGTMAGRPVDVRYTIVVEFIVR